MDFEQAYEQFMHFHIERRSGERKGRLLTRNFHGEKLFLKNIWWPLKGNLDHLHPEYEIMDWRGRSYFIDFAWIPPGLITFLWELKGFAKHIRDMDRNGFNNDTNRELFLQAVGFRIASFTFDDVSERPGLCITLLRLFLSQFQAGEAPTKPSVLGEKEVIRLAIRLARPFRPIDVSKHLDLNHRTTMKLLRCLLSKGWIIPVLRGKGERAVLFELAKGVLNYLD